MSSRHTLRGRLALVALAATALWVCALTVLLNLLLGNQLRQQADSLLRTRATASAATVEIDANGRITVRDPPNDAALDSGIWIFQGSRVLERSPAPATLQAAARALAVHGSGFTEVHDGSPVRLYARPIRHRGTQVGTIVSATSLDTYRETARTALQASVLLALLFLAAVYLVTRRVVARALRPVSAMAEQAEQWSAHDIGQRFGHAVRPAELDDLAHSLDSVLDRIAAVLRREQQVAAELSHELKTPLALIVAENDLLAARASRDRTRTQGHDVIADTAERMNELLDKLLAGAAERITEAPGRCGLQGVLTSTVAQAQPAAPATGTTLDVPADLDVGVSADIVTRILTPVLGNAYRYARTRVTVRGRRCPDSVEILVNDDGPGVPDDFRAQLFVPGRRAQADDGHPGAGLGLALALRLARSTGGDIVLVPDAVRGATFRITLPAA
jgi:signal transduction histidine kinase